MGNFHADPRVAFFDLSFTVFCFLLYSVMTQYIANNILVRSIFDSNILVGIMSLVGILY